MDFKCVKDVCENSDSDTFIPCKFPLCLICVSPISPLHLDTGEHVGDLIEANETTTISKETFLKGITILCNNLSLEDTFGREEEWTKVLGTRGNFVGSVCCGRCSQLLGSLVELHDLIVRTEVKLKECVNLVELSVVNSLGLAAEAEYSISTCLRFREEVLKSFQSRRNQNVKPYIPTSQTHLRKRKTKAKPLSVKRRLETTKLKEEALTRPVQVKLERLPPLSLVAFAAPFVANEVDCDDDDYCPSPIAEDGDDDDYNYNYDEDEEFRPRKKRRYRGTLDEFGRQRKRGRPPKPKDPNEVKIAGPKGRPRTRELKPKRKRGRPSKDLISDSIPTQPNSCVEPSDTKSKQADVKKEHDDFSDTIDDDDSRLESTKREARTPRPSINTRTCRPGKHKAPEEIENDDDQQSEDDGAYQPSHSSQDSDSGSDDQFERKYRNRNHSSTKCDRRLTKLDDPFSDRRSCKLIDKILNEDSPYYLRPFLLLDPTSGLLSFANCKIRMEPDRLVCKHPNCHYYFTFEHFTYFYAFRGMRQHIKMEHRNYRNHQKKKASSANLGELKSFYSCPYCDLEFEKRFFMIHHIKSEHPNPQPFHSVCEVCSMPLPHEDLLEHVFTHKSKQEAEVARELLASYESRSGMTKDPIAPMILPCDKCDQVFDHFSNYQIHAVRHVPIELRKQYQCDQCPEKLSSEYALRLHLEMVHSKAEQSYKYECQICGKKFLKTRKEKFDIHVRLHTGELPFQCAECGKGFRGKNALKRHEELHVNVQIPCEYCSKIYRNVRYLKKHHRKHHSDLIVTKKISTSGRIEMHPDYHGPKLMYPCEPCGKVYIYKSQLIPHLKHAHKIVYPKSSDYPNMITLEDNLEFMKGRNRVSKQSEPQEHEDPDSNAFGMDLLE